jgi:hypothetical protein
MRAPVDLSRLRFDRGSGLLVYEPKAGQELAAAAVADPLEFCGGQPFEEAPQHLIPSEELERLRSDGE